LPRTASGVISSGLLPTSNPGGRRHSRSPASSFGPAKSAAAVEAAESEGKALTSSAPAASATAMVVVARSTSKTTTVRPDSPSAGSCDGKGTTTACIPHSSGAVAGPAGSGERSTYDHGVQKTVVLNVV